MTGWRHMILYKTLAKEVHTEQIIERSRFIAHAKPVASREEAEAYLADIREQYKDATHNVPAMVIGDKAQIQWASDDGEPQGTSGAPMVQYLVKEGLTNVVVVVTRYFGGIKLGTGGLVRAYTGAAKQAVEEAGIREAREMIRLTVSFAYPYLAMIERTMAEEGHTVEDKQFAADVTMVVATEQENEESLLARLAGITKGGAAVVSREAFVG